MFKRFFLFFLIFLLFVGSCSERADNTYLEFEVDGKKYTLESIIFVAAELGNDFYFMSLGQDPAKVDIVNSVPAGGIGWKMEIADIKNLQGLNIDLSETNKEVRDPMIAFSLSKDAGVAAIPDSKMQINISRIDDNYIEGNFEGIDLMYDSVSQSSHRRVHLLGSFRARLQLSK